jgi:hypothetical protein
MTIMVGKGRWMGNIFVERLWRSLKYEEVYLNTYACVAEAKAGIGAWLDFYEEERQHQSLGYRTPRQIDDEGLWMCGRSVLPTGSASPASRASSESGGMLAFAHIPTGATANKGFDIDEMKASHRGSRERSRHRNRPGLHRHGSGCMGRGNGEDNGKPDHSEARMMLDLCASVGADAVDVHGRPRSRSTSGCLDPRREVVWF